MKKYVKILCFSAIVSMLFTGCGKKFWEYECVWYSENPYIWIETYSHDAVIEIDEVTIEATTGWKNDGTGITFYSKLIDEGRTEESMIWETDVEVKDGKLYLYIAKDYMLGMEGQTIVLEQIAYEE